MIAPNDWMDYMKKDSKTKRTRTVSLCMIVKNEEAYLKQCLHSVKGIIDEIILVDTGSNDHTLSIAEKFGAKIYSYEWNDSFADARNFSISKATCDWILFLDADEIFDQSYQREFINLINDAAFDGYLFTIYNYTGKMEDKEYSIHHAFRLMQNRKGYHFTGAIHEQIVSADKEVTILPFDVTTIVIHHYGYLNQVIKQKGKRSRNIPLIEEQLREQPDNAFYLFNLANEYLAQQNLPKALELYYQSKENLKDLQAFTTYLYYRMIICCTLLKKYEEAITLADEILLKYPNFTDIVYCRGIAEYNLHRYTVAIDSFNLCIEMGPSPILLNFLPGCHSYKPNLMKADIYRRLNDYVRAITCLTEAYQQNHSLKNILYDIGAMLNRKYTDKQEVASKLEVYFDDLKQPQNLLLYIDILITEQLYTIADTYMVQLFDKDSYPYEQSYLKGKLQFYQKEYDAAYESFLLSITQRRKEHFLQNIRKESLKYLFIIALLRKPEQLDYVLHLIKQERDDNFRKVYWDIYNQYKEITNSHLTETDNPNEILPIILDFLDQLLITKEFDLFEKYVYLLNKVESNMVLVELGRLYERNGYPDMARKTMIKSLRDLNVIDVAALDFLASIYG